MPSHSSCTGSTRRRGHMATLQTDRDALSVSLPSLRQWVLQIDGTLRPNSQMTGLQSTVEAGSYKAKGFASNVIAVIPGNHPVLKDQLVVIGSHLDHMGKRPNGDIYGGADDNVSGTAIMMELARSVLASGLKPARTLMFAAYNAEELGLIGSCHYVESAAPLPDREHEGDDQRGHGGSGNRCRPRSLRGNGRGQGMDCTGDGELERCHGDGLQGQRTRSLPGLRPRLLREGGKESQRSWRSRRP